MIVTRENVIAMVREAKVISSPDTLRDDMRLSDQGVDSLGVFDLLLRLGEKYGIEIPDADVDKLTTVSAILDYLNRRLA